MAETLYPGTFCRRTEEELMNYNHPVRNDSTMTIKAVCAVVLACFTFLWLYFFQADVLYLAQHVLSAGQTHYHRFWGAVLLTVVLWLLQLLVYRLVRLRKASHALTWGPSMLLLAVLSSVNADFDRHPTIGVWWWLAPLLLVVWSLIVWAAKTIQPYETDNRSFYVLRRVWVNLLTAVLLMIGVAVCSNTDAVFHFRTHAEVAMLHGNYDEALRVGERSLETDSSLVMVRMYALSKQGLLTERLFEYPVIPSSDVMLPTTEAVRLAVYPLDKFYRHLGAIPRRPMRPIDYLKTIIRSGQAKPAAVDYLLCGYLIDCNLDSFACKLPRYYTVNDSLPRYYREALVLYNHQRSHPLVIFHDPVLDVDYTDMRKMMATCRDNNERKGKMLEDYKGSYWYYYDFNTRLR